MKRTLKNPAKRLLATALAVASASLLNAQTIGIESEIDAAPADSQAPTSLFTFNPAGVVVIAGALTFGGLPDHFDGIAQKADGTVWCFRLTTAGSQLCRVNTATNVCTPQPTFLAGRKIRGASFEAGGRLFALDDAFNELVEVNALTGAIMGSVPLKLAGVPYALSSACDLVFSTLGVLLCDTNRFYTLSPAGNLGPLHLDGVAGTDGALVSNDGVAIEASGAVVTHDNGSRDDVYRYNPFAGFTRALVVPNVIPAISGGRGDLTSLPNVKLIRGMLVVVGGGGNPDGYIPWKWRLKEPQTGEVLWEGEFPVLPSGAFEIPVDIAGEAILEIDHPIACRRSRPITINAENGVILNVPFFMRVGDVDGSGEIDAADIDIVISNFGAPGGPADVDVSGEVDAADIDIVIANFGETDS